MEPQLPQENLLTPKSLAEMLGVSLQTIYRWSSEASIPKLKIRGSIRFRPSEINKWLEKSSICPAKKSII